MKRGVLKFPISGFQEAISFLSRFYIRIPTHSYLQLLGYLASKFI